MVRGSQASIQLVPLHCQLFPSALSSAFGFPTEDDSRRGDFRNCIGQVFKGQYPLGGLVRPMKNIFVPILGFSSLKIGTYRHMILICDSLEFQTVLDYL